jgi:hypothetical protein
MLVLINATEAEQAGRRKSDDRDTSGVRCLLSLRLDGFRRSDKIPEAATILAAGIVGILIRGVVA